MPIYEYRCDGCAQTFEKFYRSPAAAGDTTCPTCGRPARRLMSAFAHPRGATPGPDDPDHPGPPGAGDDHGYPHGFGGHGHGHSHGPGGHSHGPGALSHDTLHGHRH
jgi:putative FmdB family regulatory protein